MTNWVDSTMYRRGEGRGDARQWTYCGEHLRLTVHRIYAVEGWFLSADPAIFFQRELANADIEKAKDEAISLVRNRLSAMLAEVLP